MFRLELTNAAGEVTKTSEIDSASVKSVLLFVYWLDLKQIEFAKRVTESNPGIPYDLHTQDENGNITWTARLTKIKQPR